MLHDQHGITLNGINWTADDKKAILYLFSPQQLPMQGIRPNHFKFDGQFVDTVVSTIDQSNKNSINSIGGNMSEKLLMSNPVLDTAIIPSMQAIPFVSSSFEEFWTFMLIIDNAPSIGRAIRRSQTNRMVYLGFIVGGEPCSQLTGRLTINENATMLITHKTYINFKEELRPQGNIVLAIPQIDEDIISPSIVGMITPSREFMLDPHSLLSTYHGSTYQNDTIVADAAGLANISMNQSNIRTDTDIKNPKRQLSNVISALTSVNTYLDNPHRNNVSLFMDYDGTKEIFVSALQKRVPDITAGLDVNQPITLGTLFSNYPILNNTTQIINVPFNVLDNVIDPLAPTPTNIWTAMVQSILPSLFAYYGIANISFRYCSTNPIATSRIDDMPIYQVFDIGTIVPMNGEQMKLRWDNLYTSMVSQVFGIIKANCGNFDVTITYNGNNYCLVQLQLMDIDDRPNNAVNVQHGIVNPLATPLIGTSGDRIHNATCLDDLFKLTQMSVSKQAPQFF